MGEYSINFKGIVDKERNPFSIPFWRKEHSAIGAEGSGRPMQPTAIENFQKVLDKGGRLENIKETHREKYATFQAIRWGYAIVEGYKVIPTQKWAEISPKGDFIPKGKRKIKKVETNSQEQIVSNITKSTPTKLTQAFKEQELIFVLKDYKLKPTVVKYLDNSNLKLKTPTEILRNFTFGNSISRAFHYESPSVQYDKWASTIDAFQILNELKKACNQVEFDEILFRIAYSLYNSWKINNEKGLPSKMNIGIALKITNLLMKHLVFVNLPDRKDLIRFLHVPWDKFTLLPLKHIWSGNPRIDSSASQGFVKSMEQYIELHNFITELTERAGVKRITYEFWAWDNEK